MIPFSSNSHFELLTHVAIGDAYGAGFEFADASFVAANNDLTSYRQHHKYGFAPGAYTDDTQMSLALAEVLVSDQAWTPEVLAQKFVDVFKRDPREGYAGRFYEFLQKVEDGDQFLKEIRPTSDKNGAAMRATPLGVVADEAELVEKSVIQARLTHDTREGIDSAIAAALMSHYFVYNLGAKEDLPQYLEKYLPDLEYQWGREWSGEVPVRGIATVKAAVTAIVRNDSLSQVLHDCVAFVGDVDSVAAIALGTASCWHGMTRDLPVHLINNLENNAFGRDYIRRLDEQLSGLLVPKL